ncbi:hypothetical protein EIL87_03025 [Saccharopolyspora rhizosphaerae]|uniref:Uncharacterized protein n=1 Tax=Saccharopolyspora rhizosphaerae TaxID=2492662 RepID=A0A426K3D5_9PSEU|nr:hypothetical protein [Saccharopolyspora rhizosphaerae]RRO19965.1 hypothetical protein EIL87_03025 [Saccharopolyspora rhizosphaerae]
MTFGVANCDAMLRAGVVGWGELRRFLRHHGRYYGSRTAKRAFALLDSRAESIPESVLRVHLNLAGLHRVPQVDVHDECGHFVARVDLAIEQRKVAIEYDVSGTPLSRSGSATCTADAASTSAVGPS